MTDSATEHDAAGSCRTTVTIPRDHHNLLLRLAEIKRVSLAWIIRDAIRIYLDQQTPLLSSITRNSVGRQ